MMLLQSRPEYIRLYSLVEILSIALHLQVQRFIREEYHFTMKANGFYVFTIWISSDMQTIR